MLKQRERISHHVLTAHLEVEVIRRRTTSVAHAADHRPGFHLVARLDEVRAVVRVDRAESVQMRDLDRPTIGGGSAAEDHGARGCGMDRCALRGLNVNAAMRPQGTRAAER